jgi:hypothetical protein
VGKDVESWGVLLGEIEKEVKMVVRLGFEWLAASQRWQQAALRATPLPLR